MRYLILFALAYFIMKTLREWMRKVKIVPRDEVDVKVDQPETHSRLQVDESEIEDADFKEVE